MLFGATLARRLSLEGSLAVSVATRFIGQIASGLVTLHREGLIHRDIKPANIFLTASGLVKILDLGLAGTALGQPVSDDDETMERRVRTRTGEVLGTTPYMSPEQVRGAHLTPATDVFSLGIVLYEMLAGRNPFAKENASDTIAAVLRDAPPPLRSLRRDVSPQIEALVGRCLEKDPSTRPLPRSTVTPTDSNLPHAAWLR